MLRSNSRERKVRRPGRRSPRRNLRPAACEGRRTTSLLLVPRCVPPVFPPVRIRSPPSDSHRSPPSERRHREAAVLKLVLCKSAVATGATLGCSRVARLRRSPDSYRKAVNPAGRRLRGSTRTGLPANGSGLCRGHRPLSHPWPPGRRAARGAQACPSPAQETGKPGTRVARRTQFWSKDPL